MLIDLTVKVWPRRQGEVQGNAPFGHLGTHFDAMDMEFPLEYTVCPGVAFDVRGVRGRDIGVGDIPLALLPQGGFAAFCSGFLAEAGYGTWRYAAEHPQLSDELIDALLERGARIIGIDFAGVRRGKAHAPADQRCADRGAFVVENLANLESLLDGAPWRAFAAHTYPVNFAGITGLPCRVVAEL